MASRETKRKTKSILRIRVFCVSWRFFLFYEPAVFQQKPTQPTNQPTQNAPRGTPCSPPGGSPKKTTLFARFWQAFLFLVFGTKKMGAGKTNKGPLGLLGNLQIWIHVLFLVFGTPKKGCWLLLPNKKTGAAKKTNNNNGLPENHEAV